MQGEDEIDEEDLLDFVRDQQKMVQRTLPRGGALSAVRSAQRDQDSASAPNGFYLKEMQPALSISIPVVDSPAPSPPTTPRPGGGSFSPSPPSSARSDASAGGGGGFAASLGNLAARILGRGSPRNRKLLEAAGAAALVS